MITRDFFLMKEIENHQNMKHVEKLTKDVKRLLQQVSIVTKHYEQLSLLSGEEFNLFKVIGMTTDEVRVHSAFLAELLNPQGSHGQKAIFLELFIRILNLDTKLNCHEAIVEIEKHIGSKKENEGGRIDIFISDNSGNSIIIENKIYAGDQENQLLRYDNFGKDNGSVEYELIYLTLDGKDASSQSLGNSDIKYKRIAYRNEILIWLETCRKEATTLPTLREGITHYINLIKHLTHQSINKNMEKEIVEILSKTPESFRAAIEIKNHIQKVIDKARKQFAQKLSEKTGLTFEIHGYSNYKSLLYKNVYIYFGEYLSKIYASIKTDASLKGEAKFEKQADIFTNNSLPKHNPYGWSFVCNRRWDDLDIVYDILENGSNLENLFIKETKRIKNWIDENFDQ